MDGLQHPGFDSGVHPGLPGGLRRAGRDFRQGFIRREFRSRSIRGGDLSGKVYEAQIFQAQSWMMLISATLIAQGDI